MKFKPHLRPPGAVEEEKFLTQCARCGRCVEACPHDTLKLVKGFGPDRLTPRIVPSTTPCQLCLKCAPACPTGALDAKLTDIKQVHMGRAFILSDRCHNFTDGIMCMTCYDRCPLRGSAVILEGGFTPRITANCVGCGVCEYVCPVNGIEVLPKSAQWVPASALPTLPKPEGS